MLSKLFLVIALFSSMLHAQTIDIVTEEFPPFNYTENDEITGLNTTVVKEMFRRAGIDYTITSYPWSRAYAIAQEEPNSAIYTMSRKESREKLFRWVGPIITSQSYLFRLANNNRVKVSSLEDAKRYRVAVVRDDVRHSFLSEQGFTEDENLEVLRKYELGWEMLARGRVDLWAMPGQVARHLLEQKDIPYSALEPVYALTEVSSALYHMGLQVNTPDSTVQKLQSALDSMRLDGTLQKIADRKL